MIDIGYEHIWGNPGFILLAAGASAVIVLIAVMWRSRYAWNGRLWESIALCVIMPLAMALLIIGAVTFTDPPLNTNRVEDVYGIEQLECSDNACTWLKDGQPAAHARPTGRQGRTARLETRAVADSRG